MREPTEALGFRDERPRLKSPLGLHGCLLPRNDNRGSKLGRYRGVPWASPKCTRRRDPRPAVKKSLGASLPGRKRGRAGLKRLNWFSPRSNGVISSQVVNTMFKGTRAREGFSGG